MSTNLPADPKTQVCPKCHGKGHIPMKCVCWDSGEWNVQEPPPVCGEYQKDEYEPGICMRCSHDEACHG